MIEVNKRLIAIYIVGFILLIYLIMFINTNSVVGYVNEVMHGDISQSETNGTPLSRYNIKALEPDVDIIEANVTRFFVWHNFFDGYMYVRYSYKGTDENGKLLTASGPLFSRWKIHRENGKWKIVEIEEAP